MTNKKIRLVLCLLSTFTLAGPAEDVVRRLSFVVKPVSENLIVSATMYQPLREECDQDPLVTAGMYRIDPTRASSHRWIAVSRDLLKRWGGQFDYGDQVRVKGAKHKDGVYTIVDTMHPRFRKRIDFLETPGTKRYKFSRVEIFQL